MMKNILTIVCLLLAAAQFAASQELTFPKPADAATPAAVSSLKGRVIYEDNGKPVRHGAVSLLNAGTLTRVSNSKTLTDDNGRFIMKRIPAGSYYLSIEVAGILDPLSYPGFFGSKFGDRASARKLEGFFRKIEIDGVNEGEIVILAKRAAAIAGRVTYFDGDPAPGLRIEALRKSADGYESHNEDSDARSADIGVGVTDDRGFYRFTGLPPGEYLIYVQEKASHTLERIVGESEASDRASELKTYYPAASTSRDAKPVEVMLGGQYEGVDITVPDRRFFKLSGKVISMESKLPMKGIYINFERIDATEGLIPRSGYHGRIETDADGKWTINDLPNGKYRITFKPGYSYGDEWSEKPVAKKGPKIGNASLSITINDASQEGLVAEMPFASSISGTVTVEGGKPLPKWLFVFSGQKWKTETFGFAYVAVESDAKKADFLIENVVAGDNNVFVNLDSGQPFYVKSLKWGTTDLLRSTIPVKEGEEVKGIEIVLSDKTGLLKGKITGQDGTFDFPHILIVPVRESENEMMSGTRTSQANDEGEFQCNLAPGEYFVMVHKGGSEEEPVDDWYKRQTEGAVKVTITEGETTMITLKLPER